MIKHNTYFKGDSYSIYSILANRGYSFKFSTTFETGLKDHHIHSMLRTQFQKEKLKILDYLDFKKITHANFQSDIISKFNLRNLLHL